MAKLLIKLDNISKKYKNSPYANKEEPLALKKVNLKFFNGEIIGIIGHNGSGKSTLLKIIAGHEFTSSGKVLIKKKVSAVLSTEFNFNENLTGLKIIQNHVRNWVSNNENSEKIISEIVEFIDIGNDINFPFKHYSTGMKARLSLALAFQNTSDILIIDEVLSVGDNNFVLKCLDRIKKLMKKKKLVIIVSHSLSFIIDMCSRCICLESGKVVKDGPPYDVVSSYIKKSKKKNQNNQG